jgi:osmotically-inducible protein OsmY
MGKRLSFLAGAALGAAAAFFLDPQGGARRRNMARDKARSNLKSSGGGAAAAARQAAGKARGTVSAVTPSMPGSQPDDVTLARKVETEIFRPADAPKGQVTVNAENGVVFLRGEVEEGWIERLGADAERVDGVKAVRNLLHRPGTEAPVAPATR